jgi:hypothetical protein
MEKTEKVFAEGFMFKMKPNSPEWVVGSLSLKADEAIAFIQKNTDKGWVNLNVNIGKSGKPYVELDTWKPTQAATTTADPEFNSEGLPF